MKQVVSKLVKGNMEMITACFDEYYFIIPEGVIKPQPVNAGVYQAGEDVPVKGETYQFPDDFNIIDLHFNMVASVRRGKLHNILPMDEFRYDGDPSVNMMGFAIKLESQEDLDAFRAHYKTFSLTERSKLAAFANRWFEITKYRNVGYL